MLSQDGYIALLRSIQFLYHHSGYQYESIKTRSVSKEALSLRNFLERQDSEETDRQIFDSENWDIQPDE